MLQGQNLQSNAKENRKFMRFIHPYVLWIYSIGMTFYIYLYIFKIIVTDDFFHLPFGFYFSSIPFIICIYLFIHLF